MASGVKEIRGQGLMIGIGWMTCADLVRQGLAERTARQRDSRYGLACCRSSCRGRRCKLVDGVAEMIHPVHSR